jgi:hypothetical protein
VLRSVAMIPIVVIIDRRNVGTGRSVPSQGLRRVVLENRRNLSLAKYFRDLVLQRLDQVGNHGPILRAHEGFNGHAGH